MNHFRLRTLAAALSLAGLLNVSPAAVASGFQLFEQDAVSVANYHAGYAAAASNASTAFYNPAGMCRFKDQQFVLTGINAFTNIRYSGTISVDSINNGEIMPATAQGGGYGFVPAMHYVAPVSEQVAFGLSIDVPFGLRSNYGKKTVLRYSATVTSAQVIDISPVLSYKFNDHLSFGAGPDLQIMKGEFNQVGTLGDESFDSDGLNAADDTGYGFHAGVLYAVNDNSRLGLSYHSQVVHHLTGISSFTGPLAAAFDVHESDRAKLNLTLPPYTALSAYHRFNDSVAIMGSIIYTQWSTLKNLIMTNVAGIANTEPSTDITVVLPLHFHNTLTYSLGTDYFATEKLTLRGGLGYDQTPFNNTYRNVQLPDNNRFVLAVGGHYQLLPTLGLDLGWAHVFLQKAHISPPPQVSGDVTVVTSGSVTGGANVIAAQVVWDMV